MYKPWNIVKAVISRIVFLLCIFLTCWRAATVLDYRNSELFILIATPSTETVHYDVWKAWIPFFVAAGLYVPEIIITILVNKGDEFKWWWPSIAIFLGGNIPAIWMVELDHYDRVTQLKIGKFKEEGLMPILGGFVLPIELTPPIWAKLLEQISFVALIVAKWLLPRGIVSHSQMSQILFMFIGIASDILDLMDNLHSDIIHYDKSLVYVILGFYTFSHFQFTLNYTALRKYKMRWQSDNPNLSRFVIVKRRIKYMLCCSFETELWVLFSTIVSMDGLFFFLRLYLLLGGLRLVTFGNIFFIAKNLFVVAIDIYRIITIINEMKRENAKYKTGFDENTFDTANIDRNILIDMHLILDANGKMKASAKALKETYFPDRKIVLKKTDWTYSIYEHPGWNKFEKSMRPKKELKLKYNLDMVFDPENNKLNGDDRALKCLKELEFHSSPNLTKSSSVFKMPQPNSNSIRPWDSNTRK